MPNLLFKMVDDIHVSVGLSENPTDEEWDNYIKDIGENLPAMKGLLSCSGGGQPTPPQRHAVNRFWAAQTKKVPLAIVTTSRLVKIVVTALSWVMGDRIRGFTTVDEGLDYLQVSADRRAPLHAAVNSMREALKAERN